MFGCGLRCVHLYVSVFSFEVYTCGVCYVYVCARRAEVQGQPRAVFSMGRSSAVTNSPVVVSLSRYRASIGGGAESRARFAGASTRHYHTMSAHRVSAQRGVNHPLLGSRIIADRSSLGAAARSLAADLD